MIIHRQPRCNSESGPPEERRYYLTDPNYNVVMTVDDAGRGSERIFYKAYGEPECYSFGDVDGDYDVDNEDATELATIVSNGGQPYNVLADLNLDGAITQGDANLHSYYLNRSGGQNVLSVDDEANDVGYAGYLWSDERAQWHVRHRELSPKLGRWLQRDPAHYAETMSLYSYVANDPLIWVDPFGLRRCGPWVWYLTGWWCAEDEVYEAAYDAYAQTANDRLNGYGDAVGIDGLAGYLGGTDFTFDELERLKGECWAKCFAMEMLKPYLEQLSIPGLDTFSFDADDLFANDPDDLGITPLFDINRHETPGDIDDILRKMEEDLERRIKNKEWKKIPRKRRGRGQDWRRKYEKNLEEIRGIRRGTSPLRKILGVLNKLNLIKDVWDIVRDCESKCQESCESGKYRAM